MHDELTVLNRDMEISQQNLEHLMNTEQQLEEQVKMLKSEKYQHELLKEITNNGLNQLENELNSERKLAHEDRQTLEELRRARDILQKELNRAENNNKRQMEEFI